MAKKQNYSYRTRRSDTLMSRMIVVFVLLLISTFLLMYIKNWLDTPALSLDFYDTYIKVVHIFPILPLILCIAALTYFIICRRKKLDEGLKVFSSYFILTIALVFLTVSVLIANFIYTGYLPSIIFIVLVSLLYFISVCYPGAYLIITVYNALGAFAIYALHMFSPTDNPLGHYLFSSLAIIISLAFGYIIYLAKKNGGRFASIELFKPETNIIPIYIAVLIFVIFALLGMFNIGSYLIYDIIIAFETIILALVYAIKTLK